MYCVYNGKKYKIKKKNDKYIITSRVRKEDFINYIDVLGNKHSELYMKIVKANEVDIISVSYTHLTLPTSDLV